MNKGRHVLVEMRNIAKSFPAPQSRLPVLADLSLRIHAGEITAVMGPSGCGKTTLLQITAGLLDWDQGELIKESGLRLAYVFQEPRLLPWMTVEENIRLAQGGFLPPAEAEPLRLRLLKRTGLELYRKAYPLQLSGGLRQRVELVRALAVKPDLLLMDEPFQAVDLGWKEQLQELLLEEHSQAGFGVILVTHNPEDALMLADRVVVLSDKPTVIRKEFPVRIPRDQRSIRTGPLLEQLGEVLELVRE